jgi:predicted ATPase
LKDLVEAERLYQLGKADFPPLRTLDATNLPIAASALLGRDEDVEAILARFADGQRLVTITGPGGTGKTRLALQVAAELVGTVADGVFWVGLAPLADPNLVPAEIAQTIGAPDDLRGFLRDRELVVLLDNFEHLLAAADTVAELLSGARGLRVLVTSRAPLRIAGEAEYPLEPLGPTDAVTLLVERARAIGREVPPDETAAAICSRLDRLPLAIELAAARLRLFGPEKLLDRLEHVLPLLTDGSRDAPERQRTLRGTIEWSHELLDEQSKRLFARLAVFAGGFPVEAAESVCDAGVAELSALVDLSLLKPIGGDRFLMLETIREYAGERLTQSGEEDELRQRHAEEFRRLAENAYSRRFDEESEMSAALVLDHDDLRVALDWLEGTDEDAALDLAGALGWFWLSRGFVVEGDARLSGLLATSQSDGVARARALSSAGALAARRGDSARGRSQLEEGVARYRTEGDRAQVADALDALGWLLVYDAGDDEASLRAFEEAHAIRRDLGDPAGETRALIGVCQVLVALGEVDRAETMSNELLERAEGDLRCEHFAHHFLADCSIIRGDCALALERYRRSLEAALALGDVFETSIEVQGIAMARAGCGHAALALELAAAVDALWTSLGISISVAFWDALLARYLGQAREQLGADAEEATSRGRALPFDDAVELARQAS